MAELRSEGQQFGQGLLQMTTQPVAAPWMGVPTLKRQQSSKVSLKELQDAMLFEVLDMATKEEAALLNTSPKNNDDYMRNLSQSFTILARRMHEHDPNVQHRLKKRAILGRLRTGKK